MKDLTKRPFEHHDWTDSELMFAMTFTDKKERILIGTKAGIQARLRQKGEAAPEEPPFDGIGLERDSTALDAVKTAASDAVQMMADMLCAGPAKATKKEQERIRERAQRELPLVSDRSYELGHLLLNFERDPEKKWDAAINDLAAALELRGKKSREYEAQAKEFLQGRWDTRNPVCQFAVLKIWQDYCAVRRIKTAGEEALIPYRPDELPQQIGTFSFSAKRLTDCFWQRPDAEPNVRGRSIAWNDPVLRLPPMLKHGEDELRLWMIDGANFELAVLSESFYPIKQYCRLKLNERGVKFNRCIVCGGFFATHTRKQETCGTVCAKLRKAQTTTCYHEKSKGDQVELMRNQAYQYWYNRVRKAERIKDFPPEKMDVLRCEFESFKQELKVYKKRAAEKSISLKEFRSWILAQENLASEMMGKYDERWYASR